MKDTTKGGPQRQRPSPWVAEKCKQGTWWDLGFIGITVAAGVGLGLAFITANSCVGNGCTTDARTVCFCNMPLAITMACEGLWEDLQESTLQLQVPQAESKGADSFLTCIMCQDSHKRGTEKSS